MTATQPIKIAILAMGGEGGGVLADWIVELGEQGGYLAQTTSVPGVAQRTGATIYYVELYPLERARRDGAQPVLALMPLPGDVDVVLASELMEAARAVQRGLVTPGRTTLIASTHRIYSIAEKMNPGDGRVDSGELAAHAQAAARRFVRFNMAQAARDSGCVISAALFGALAATGALPFSRAQFEAAIASGGVGVQPSLKGFADAYARVVRADADVDTHADANTDTSTDAGVDAQAGHGQAQAGFAGFAGFADTPAPAAASLAPPSSAPADTHRHPSVQALLDRIERDFPASARPTLIEGARRLVDYQDPDYAALYLDRVQPIAQITPRLPGSHPGDAGDDETLTETVARHLAPWMAYEDTIRVAQIKTRAARFERIRQEASARDDQVLSIHDFLHPRVREISEILPAPWGRWLERPGWPRRLAERLTRRGRIIDTTSLRGFLLLYGVAGLKRWRRRSARYAQETRRIEDWLRHLAQAAAIDRQLALEIAQCPRLLKGYGDTHERASRHFETVMRAVRHALATPGAALAPAVVNELRTAALTDETGHALQAALARHALQDAEVSAAPPRSGDTA